MCVYEGGGPFACPVGLAPSLAQLYVCVLDAGNVSMCPKGGGSVCMWVCVSLVIIIIRRERACVYVRRASKKAGRTICEGGEEACPFSL
jgi:hypothetical protein